MFKIETVDPSNATGEIAEMYGMFPPQFGIPAPMRLFSASPGLMRLQMSAIGFWREHETLSFPLLTAIRFLMADNCDFGSCIDFNSKILMSMGMTPEDLATLKTDPASGPLEDRENQMLAFVAGALKKPETATEERIDSLRSMGWTDKDIYEALFHGAMMIGGSAVYNALAK